MKIFKREIDLIEDRELKKICKQLLKGLPEYFYVISASSSGKYHPKYTLGEGGLVRHTKACIKIAEELLYLEQYLHLKPFKDHIIIALLLHDGLKQGLEEAGKTVLEHPNLMADYINSYKVRKNKLKQDLNLISRMVRSHMGQWTGGLMPKPANRLEDFVHLCDFFASRKFIEIDLGD